MPIVLEIELNEQDIDRARRMVEKALAVLFIGHDSLYWGGDYYRCVAADGVSLKLFRNTDLVDPGPIRERFGAGSIILSVVAESDCETLRQAKQIDFHAKKEEVTE